MIKSVSELISIAKEVSHFSLPNIFQNPIFQLEVFPKSIGGKDKSFVVALILFIFLGDLGIDRFYMDYVGLEILKLITFGGFGIWWLIGLVLIVVKNVF